MLNERNTSHTNYNHMGTIKETLLAIGQPFRRLINNIKMSYRWAKFGWNDRDFDFIYIIRKADRFSWVCSLYAIPQN